MELVQAAADYGVDFYGSRQDSWRPIERDAFGRSGNFLANAFPYDSDRDCFPCPAGKILTRGTRFSRGHGVYTRVYHAGKTVCAPCPFRSQCAPANAQPGWRGAIRHIEEPAATTAFQAKMTIEEAQQIYAQRSQIAEFPQAWIKERSGLRQFRCRGRWPVSMEDTWACHSYNLARWCSLRRKFKMELAHAWRRFHRTLVRLRNTLPLALLPDLIRKP